MMDAQELRPLLLQRVKDVTEVLGIPTAAAMVLLRAYDFSKEDLLEAYMLSPDKVLRNAGVYCRCNTNNTNNNTNNKATSTTTTSQECPICYEDNTSHNMLAMPCGHAFCMDCWHDFCTNAVQDQGPAAVTALTCPQATCPEIVTEVEMEQALLRTKNNNDKRTLQKYYNFQLRAFVEANHYTRWCPGPGCERVACAESAAAMESEGAIAHCDVCTNVEFCVVCGEEPHAPSPCKELAIWNEKCRNESETANWILANTKSCPKCSSRIEKNQGCNHMTCQRCKYEFCWICMGDWSQHGANTGGYYKCNKFDNGDGSNNNAGDQSDAARAKRELDRYLHYYKRFHAHSQAQAFAVKSLKETESRMIQLQDSSADAKWTDVEFLKAANEQLVVCRRVLKYTYVFAYYMDPRNVMQRTRFEHHQEMLERFTENLSELSEKPLAEMNRTDVVNQTRVVDRFVKNILKYVEDGMEDSV
jgi:ariadne-1